MTKNETMVEKINKVKVLSKSGLGYTENKEKNDSNKNSKKISKVIKKNSKK